MPCLLRQNKLAITAEIRITLNKTLKIP